MRRGMKIALLEVSAEWRDQGMFYEIQEKRRDFLTGYSFMGWKELMGGEEEEEDENGGGGTEG